MRRWLCGWMAAAVAWGGGLALAEEAARDSGPEVMTLVTSGRELLTAGKTTEAMAILEKAVKLDAQSNEARFLLGAAYIEAERYEDARPMLESLLTAMPDNPMIRNNLAWVYVKSKNPAVRNPAKAVKLARAAVMDAPSDYLIWNTLSEAYYAEGRYDRALRAAESALRLSVLAGVTNAAASRELVSRCRKAVDGAGGPEKE